jgi:hypothetical protein
VLTIRFCLPGNDRVPAGVTHVGFWIAAVSPDGTALAAYDARDQLLAEVKTVAHNRDFLAVRSSVPISYIKVVPNAQIDPNYTIDDLVFDPPTPMAEAGDAELFTVVLRSGERLKCDNVSLGAAPAAAAPARDQAAPLRLRRLAVTGEDFALPADQAARVLTPTGMWRPGERGGALWAMLADGSVLRADPKAGQIAPQRLPSFRPKPRDDLAALWGATAVYAEPAEGAAPAKGSALALMPSGQKPRTLTTWKLGAAGVESPDWKSPAPPYDATPPLWFAAVPRRAEPAGLLRLTNGEELVLGKRSFALESWSSQRVTLRRGGQTVEVAPSEVLSLALPKE